MKKKFERKKPRKPKDIRNYVVWLLGRREYSEHELRERLAQRECEPHEIDEVIKWAQSNGYQSDSRYASMKARSEANRRGDRWIQYTLSSKGIAKEEIEEQIANLPSESERAVAAVSRFEGQPLDYKFKQKIWRFLGSRGFSPDAIRAAVEHLQEVLGQRADTSEFQDA